MPQLDLSDEEMAALVRLLRDATDADRYPLSPRVERLRGILNKLKPVPVREPLPPLRHYEPPSKGRYSRRR